MQAKENRPALLVSSTRFICVCLFMTSWTADEDFHILLDALAILDSKSFSSFSVMGRFDENDGLRVVCMVTGVGPLKAYYEQCISEMPLKHVIIKTMSFCH